MTLSTYWWSPTRELRGAAGEAVHHPRAWRHLVRHGGRRLINFGDEVSPWLVEELTGRRPVWSPVQRADLICVGSVLDAYARSGGTGRVLGSGVRQPETAEVGNVVLDRVLLVRGRGTRSALGLAGDTPLGDPGLVVANIVSPPRHALGGVVVVPHFAALGHGEVRRLLDACGSEGWRILMPNLHPLEMARSIAGADLVLTSSLHGLVFADAFGVSAQLVTMVGGPGAEPTFKYEDYGSALDACNVARPLGTLLGAPDVGGWIEALEERTALVAARLGTVVDAIYGAGCRVA